MIEKGDTYLSHFAVVYKHKVCVCVHACVCVCARTFVCVCVCVCVCMYLCLHYIFLSQTLIIHGISA